MPRKHVRMTLSQILGMKRDNLYLLLLLGSWLYFKNKKLFSLSKISLALNGNKTPWMLLAITWLAILFGLKTKRLQVIKC